jgi:hypothetical protein
VIALWATPRTASTAFERMMIERGDHTVVNEPWSRCYYYGPERRSPRFDETLERSTHVEVLDHLDRLTPTGPVFVKDMPYHVLPHLDADVVSRFTNTFIIRDPVAAIPSLAKMWSDFTWEEAGYEAQERAFDLAAELAGETPVVIDSDELRRDPDEFVRAWCEAVGIEHRPDAMTWKPGMPAEWDLWHDWYARAATTTGFVPPDPDGSRPQLCDDLAETVERARTTYERLFAARLRP